MTTLSRTDLRVRLLRDCQRGTVRWDPAASPSGWIINDVPLHLTHPSAIQLGIMHCGSLTHECDSQEITRAGAALLREWTGETP